MDTLIPAFLRRQRNQRRLTLEMLSAKVGMSPQHLSEIESGIILGPPGVGKTHMAVSLGLKAIEAGYRVLFTTAAHLIGSLTKAVAEGKLDDKLKFYTTPRLLIIDEIG